MTNSMEVGNSSVRTDQTKLIQQKIEFPILCIDYGTKKTGFSIAMDEKTPIYLNETCSGDKLEILFMIEKFSPKLILFGLPVNVQNKTQSDKVKSLGGYIKIKTGIKVMFQDERFSSKMADDLLNSNSKNVIYSTKAQRSLANDQVAAFIILDIFLKINFKCSSLS